MKTSKWLLIVTGCLFVSLSSPALGLELQLGEVQKGSISLPGQPVIYTFGANAGEVIDFTATRTSGTLSPKLRLYDSHGKLIATAYSVYPDGTCTGAPVTEMNTILLSAGGTYTLDVGDCADTNTGDYDLYSQSTNHPVRAEPLGFGQTQSGAIGLAAQSNTFTFDANVNDEIDFTMTTTSGNVSPKIRVYKPNGALLSAAYSIYPDGTCTGASVTELNTLQIPASGRYTVLVGDCSDTNTGNYDIYAQTTEHPFDAVHLPFGQTQSGKISLAAQNNSYTIMANVNDKLDFTVTASGLSPKIRVYKPNGALLSAAYSVYPDGTCTGAPVTEMNTLQIPATGTYTVLIGDCSDRNTGDYNVYAQRTNNPSGAGILLFGPAQSDLIGSPAQSNSYTFSGSKNEVINLTMVTTTGTVSPKMRLYNPNGTLLTAAYSVYPDGTCTGASTIEMNSVTLSQTGDYTVLVGDCSDTNTGNYAIYAQSTNMPFGPAPVDWGQVQPNKIASPAQSNTYIFSGAKNDVVDLTMVTTSGVLSPKIRLYNPDGTLLSASYSVYPDGVCTGASTIEMNSVMLPQDGDYAILVGDCSDRNTGKYDLSSQCFGTCKAMPAITWTPPTAITYCTALSGAQLDATSNVAGQFTYLPSFGTVLNLGPHNLSTTLTPKNETQYTSARDFVQLTVKRAPSSILLATSLDPTTFGEPVTFTATVKPSGCGAAGTVTFMNGSSALGTVALSSGAAKLTTSALWAGSHTITAIYGGSTEFFGSTSPALTQNVRKASTSTSVTASQNPSKAGQPVTFTATVTSTAGIPHGSVTFKNGTLTWGTVALVGGNASFTVSMQQKGSHSVTAEYGGGINFLESTSPVLIHIVD